MWGICKVLWLLLKNSQEILTPTLAKNFSKGQKTQTLNVEALGGTSAQNTQRTLLYHVKGDKAR